MFAEAIESILAEHGTPAQVRAIEAGASPQALASAIADAGFHELMSPEDRGGGGASWQEFFDVVTLCGARAVPLPLAQTLAARAVASQPEQLPQGLITFAPALVRGAEGGLQALHVPAARVASHVLGMEGGRLLLLPVAGAEQLASGIHGSLLASLRWPAQAGMPVATVLDEGQFEGLGALLHAGLLAGAMKRAFDLTMAYANERVQFGKPIGKFQSIQHQLSVMAEQVAAGRIAAEAAFASSGKSGGLAPVRACAVAKARSSEAAQLVASIAHAVHGAIGVTEEYDLQLVTRRLHEWRIAHGSEAYWHRRLGQWFIESREPLAADFARMLFEGASA